MKDTSWGNVADWYSDLLESTSDTYQSEVVAPNLVRLIKPSAGMSILDVACGQGYFSRIFASHGAQVTGVDLGSALIEYAKAHSPQEILYFNAPSHTMDFLKDRSFDAISIVLAIQNIELFRETFLECSRVLKEKGRMYLILNHPAFRIPKQSHWGFDEKTNTQYRRVDEYLGESTVEIDMHPGTKDSPKTISFHRPLQVYAKALEKSGFAITRIEEWTSHKKSQPGPRQKAEDKSRAEIPLFMMLEVRKIA